MWPFWRGRSKTDWQANACRAPRLRYIIPITLASVGIGVCVGNLPAAASIACVSAATCAAENGVVITYNGSNFCSGGSPAVAGASICGSASPTPPTSSNHGAPKYSPAPYLPAYSISSNNSNHGMPNVGSTNLSHLDGPVYFSMYSSDTPAGPYVDGDIFGIHNTGYRVSDSAGAIAPGSLAPGFNSLGGGGGGNLVIDATKALPIPTYQQLLFGINVDYQRLTTSYGTSALTPGVSSAGSEQSNTWSFSGSASYSNDRFYATGMAQYDVRQSNITSNVGAANASGSMAGQGYMLNAAAGYLLPLFGTGNVTSSTIPTKALPSRINGYGLFLNVEGDLGYQKQWNNGFTDTSGFVYGTEQFSYTDLGAKVQLIAVVPSTGFSWMPFVGGGVDQLVGFTHTFDIPAQAATAADTIFFGESTTFWTVQAGLSVINRAAIQAGVSGFYSTSADTSVFGGNVFVKIPFYADVAPVGGGGGIRAAAK
jgi:hypothetical protein